MISVDLPMDQSVTVLVQNEDELSRKERRNHTVIIVKADRISNSAIKQGVDGIRLTNTTHINKRIINVCKEKTVFIQVDFGDYERNRLEFCTMMRKLREHRAWRVLVCSFGSNLVHSEAEVMGILAGFGFSRRNSLKVVENSTKMIRLGIIKQNGTNGRVIDVTDKAWIEKWLYR
ncbi:hypothetical protein ECANGB1_1066 [Enterospora canceri]|uniref:Uncharacterized protein n=1 Tax=Enterospora canceri TaxID=1081671 RepID=A0A1Y1S6X3_9MICR|nr:hypothetical protein ECANGB1_1066 [Enterospora canceri]